MPEDEFSQFARQPAAQTDEFAQFARKPKVSEPPKQEGRFSKAWRVANTPLLPEGRAEREGHEIADKHVLNMDHPAVAALETGVAGAYADTLEFARGLTSPLALATVGLGEVGKLPGAAGKVATAVSKIAGTGFAAQGAGQAASGVADIAKRGITPENTKKALGGAGQAVLGATAVGGKTLQDYATERLPHRMITNLIKPSTSDVKFGKDPARAVLDEKIVGNSLPELGEKVYDKLHEVGKEIDTTLKAPQNAAKRVDTSSALKPIDDAMVKAAKDGDRGLYVRLANMKKQYTMDWHQTTTKGGASTIAPVGPKNMQMSPYDAVTFKRSVGDSTKWTGNDPFEDRMNAVKGEIYGNLKNQINQAVPEVKPLNERYSNLVGAGKAIERRIPVAERNAQWSLSDIALGASGHIPLAIARKAMSLPAVKTRVARGLNSLAPE